VSPPRAKGSGSDEPSLKPQPARSEKVPFDSVNLTLMHDTADEFIRVLVLVPLVDGSSTQTVVTLGTPTKLTHPDGRLEYKMVIDSDLSVTPMEKEPTGKTRTGTRDGLRWEIPQGYPGASTGLLDHEPLIRDYLMARFHGGKVFVDVGANVGAYALRAALVGMKVHAFEPNPENVKILRRNAEINGLSIDIYEAALGAEARTVNLSSMGATSRVTEEDGIAVPMTLLDRFKLPMVELIKVDVEGHELEVLEGSVKTLERFHPELMIEMHHWIGAEKEAAIFDILSGLGYRFEYLDRFTQGRHLVATYAPPTSADPRNR
jgi:FkbM family methyltransferase